MWPHNVSIPWKIHPHKDKTTHTQLLLHEATCSYSKNLTCGISHTSSFTLLLTTSFIFSHTLLCTFISHLLYSPLFSSLTSSLHLSRHSSISSLPLFFMSFGESRTLVSRPASSLSSHSSCRLISCFVFYTSPLRSVHLSLFLCAPPSPLSLLHCYFVLHHLVLSVSVFLSSARRQLGLMREM